MLRKLRKNFSIDQLIKTGIERTNKGGTRVTLVRSTKDWIKLIKVVKGYIVKHIFWHVFT